MKNEKYILYGASFNPPHVGHLSAILQMLEDHDKVIVFPYPAKYSQGKKEELPPLRERMNMLTIFIMSFFPKMADRLMLINLAEEIKKEEKNERHLHTYDYLQYVKNKIPNGSLSVCLGFDKQNIFRKESFYNEELIIKEFPDFYLQEENTIKSEDLREFFSNNKNVNNKKSELYIQSVVGPELAEYIFKNNLYGLKKKLDKKESFVKPEKIKHKI